MAKQVNTSHHIEVWHDDFWKLNVANFFITLPVYMLVAILPVWLLKYVELSDMQVASTMGIYGCGVFLFGAVCSYLIQRYRRNKVCIISMLLMVACILSIAYLSENLAEYNLVRWVFPIVLVLRALLGAFFGLSFMILNSTLIVDCCDTSKRTLANVVSAWSYRLAIVVGMFLGLWLEKEFGFLNTIYLSAFFSMLSVGILSSVSFPFKAPDESLHVFSLDRFFRLSSMRLVTSTFMIAALLGVTVVVFQGIASYLGLLFGVLLSLLVQKIPFVAYKKRGMVLLCYLLLALSVLCQWCSYLPWLSVASFVLTGFSLSAVLTVFHREFIDTADHCQRGTSQSTFMLSFESGFSLGIFVSILSTVELHTLFISYVFLLLSVACYFYRSKIIVFDKPGK